MKEFHSLAHMGKWKCWSLFLSNLNCPIVTHPRGGFFGVQWLKNATNQCIFQTAPCDSNQCPQWSSSYDPPLRHRMFLDFAICSTQCYSPMSIPLPLPIPITVILMGNTFDLFDGHCDGQSGLHTHFARQRNVCYGDSDGVAGCERALTLTET